MQETDPRLIRLAPGDDVLVLATGVAAGETLRIDGAPVEVRAALSLGHKLAARDIGAGETVMKYAFPIGVATAPIPKGGHVHVHNLRSAYTPTHVIPEGA